MKRRTKRGWLILLLATLAFVPLIGQRDVTTSHEARVIQVARQMAAVGWPWSGKKIDVPTVHLARTSVGLRFVADPNAPPMQINPWIVPILNGEVRAQKPPLPYWCAAILFKIFGTSAAAARLIPAMLGAILALIVWDLATKLLGGIDGWFAALVWISSYFIVDEFRKAMADPYLAFFSLVCIWSWLRGMHSDAKSRGWILAFYLSAAMAMLAKGPLFLIVVAPTIMLFHITYRRRAKLIWLDHVIGLILFLLISLPWYLAVWRAVPSTPELWRYQSVGQLSDNAEKARGWWYYLPALLQLPLPWTPIWLIGLAIPIIYPRRRRAFTTAAFLVVVFIFSLSNVKKHAYLLPAMPLAVLTIVQGFLLLCASAKNRMSAIRAVTIIAILLALVAQGFLSFVTTARENARSPRRACEYVAKLLEESPDRSILASELAEEASVYLPLGLRDSNSSSEVLFLADDRQGNAEEQAAAIHETAAGQVTSVEPIPLPPRAGNRWKLFKLRIAHLANSNLPIDPASVRFDIRARAISSSESPADRGNF